MAPLDLYQVAMAYVISRSSNASTLTVLKVDTGNEDQRVIVNVEDTVAMSYVDNGHGNKRVLVNVGDAVRFICDIYYNVVDEVEVVCLQVH